MKCFHVVALLLVPALTAQAENWPNWRGPHYNGSTAQQNLPAEWSRTENVAWSVAMAGPSAATPVIWDDHVFVSSTDTKSDTLLAMCFDRKTGQLHWSHEVGRGIRKDSRSTFSAPSPVTDGRLVFFFYGNGDLIAYDLQGREQWAKNVGPFAFGWTFSTSPVLFEGKLYIQILQHDARPGQNESHILALEPETGEVLWRSYRPSDAVAESLEAFTTPTPFEYNGRKELLVAGGDCFTGHDLETGKELWRWGTWNPGRIGHWRLVPSPVASEDVVIVCAPKGEPIFALPAGGRGILSDDALLWLTERKGDVTSDVPTPALYDGDFFILNGNPGNGRLSRVVPRTGEVKWTIRTPGRAKYEASPLAGDGKIYIMNFDGDVSVVAADSGQVRNTIAMETREDLRNEGILNRSSIAAAYGQLFIRTHFKLWCIGE